MLLFLSLIIDLYFLIPAAIEQVFNAIAELVIPIGILSMKAKTEIEIHLVTAEAKVRKRSNNLYNVQTTFFYFLLVNSFWSIFSSK